MQQDASIIKKTKITGSGVFAVMFFVIFCINLQRHLFMNQNEKKQSEIDVRANETDVK